MHESTFIQPKRVHSPESWGGASLNATRVLLLRLLLVHVCVLGLSMVFIEPPTMAPLGGLIACSMLCSMLIIVGHSCRRLRTGSKPISEHPVASSPDAPRQQGADIGEEDMIHQHLEQSIARATRSGRKCVVYSLSCSSPEHPTLDALMTELAENLSTQLSARSVVVHQPGSRLRVLSDSASGHRFSYRLAHRLMTRSAQWLGDRGIEEAIVSVGISQFPDHGRDPQRLIELADHAIPEHGQLQRSRCSMATQMPATDSCNVIALPVRTSRPVSRRKLRIHA